VDILLAILIFFGVLLGIAIALFLVGFIGFIVYFFVGLGWNAAQSMFASWDIR
jgi:hypothetical protein